MPSDTRSITSGSQISNNTTLALTRIILHGHSGEFSRTSEITAIANKMKRWRLTWTERVSGACRHLNLFLIYIFSVVKNK